MTTTDARDELAAIIARTFRIHPNGVAYLNHEGGADEVLAAGYRKPRTITTVEELDALREGAVIRDAEHLVLELDSSAADRTVLAWHFGDDPVSAELPATVLWESEA